MKDYSGYSMRNGYKWGQTGREVGTTTVIVEIWFIGGLEAILEMKSAEVMI